MIHAFLAITGDNVLTEEADGFDGDLTFAGALFDGLEIFYGVFGTA
jgi:hypothetical protein